MCWSPDWSVLVSGSFDGTLRVCDMEVGTVLQVVEGGGEVISVGWSCSHQVVSAAFDGTVRV